MKSVPGENHADNRIDAAANRSVLREARITRDDDQLKTVHLEWEPLKAGGRPGIQDVSILRRLPAIRIDYQEWPVNTVDIGSPGGTKQGSYEIYGAGEWKREYLLYPKVYFDRAPKDVGHENITEVDEVGPLDYHGWFIMGIFNKANGRGYGRVVPTASVDIIKLLWNRGFELFPCYGRKHEPFSSYLFVVSGGPEEIIRLGQRLADLETPKPAKTP